MNRKRPFPPVFAYLTATAVLIGSIIGVRQDHADAIPLPGDESDFHAICRDLPGRYTPDDLRLIVAERYCPNFGVIDLPVRDSKWPPNVERWRRLFERLFEPEDVETALRVVNCESRGDPEAKNPRSSASGLWQHLARYWGPTWNRQRLPGGNRAARAGIPGASIWDPEASTIVAAWLVYEAGGWIHWPCH